VTKKFRDSDSRCDPELTCWGDETEKADKPKDHAQSQVTQGVFLSVRLIGAAPSFQVPAISEFSLLITPS
jgi:hypothetical protein